ncbi:MAG: hypothetical protein M5T61_09140 [Acidimicrobiia bacterium]|nr:hypothetical protein [Acidimicrobiia bacterium]
MLILVDEVLDYVRQLSLAEHGDLATRDMAFLRALTDTVNDIPHVAMVVVMIRSEDDSIVLDAAGLARRPEIEDLLVRNGRKTTVTSNTDFAEIIRRRLFETSAPAEVVGATSDLYERTMKGTWAERVFAHLPRPASGEFASEVAVLPVPPCTDPPRRAGVGAGLGLPEGSVDHTHLRGDGVCAV